MSITAWAERRYERDAARRYSHTILRHRECGIGVCWKCFWRTLTGFYERERRQTRDRMAATKPTPVKRYISDERRAQARAEGQERHIDASGQQRCPFLHGRLQLTGSRCLACGARR